MELTQIPFSHQQMPPFSFTAIAATTSDYLHIIFYCFIWNITEKIILNYTPMPEYCISEYENAGQDPIALKKALNNFTQYKQNIKTIIHNIYGLVFGTYYVFTYGLRVDTWCNNLEYTMCKISLSYFVNDLISGFYYEQNDVWIHIHHVISIIGASVPFLYRRFGSEVAFATFLGEISGLFFQLRSVLPFIGNNSLANSFKFLFRNHNVDNAERKRRAELIRSLNEMTFVVTFIIARTFGFEFLGHQIQISKHPLILKLPFLWFLSYFWLWDIVNKCTKVLATEIFPDSEISKKVYSFFKSIRPLKPLYLLTMLWYTSRHLLTYYKIYDYLM